MLRYEGLHERSVMLETRNGTALIQWDDIAVIEYHLRKIHFTLADGSVFSTRTIRSAFTEQVAPILEDPDFVRPHQSFVVNLKCVRGIGGTELLLRGGAHIPLARGRRQEICRRFAAGTAELTEECSACGLSLQRLMDLMPVGLCVFQELENNRLALVYFNQALCRCSSATPAQIYASYAGSPFSRIHPEDQAEPLRLYQELRTGQRTSAACRCRIRTGRGQWQGCQLVCRVSQEHGMLTFFLVYNFDQVQ